MSSRAGKPGLAGAGPGCHLLPASMVPGLLLKHAHCPSMLLYFFLINSFFGVSDPACCSYCLQLRMLKTDLLTQSGLPYGPTPEASLSQGTEWCPAAMQRCATEHLQDTQSCLLMCLKHVTQTRKIKIFTPLITYLDNKKQLCYNLEYFKPGFSSTQGLALILLGYLLSE